MATGQTDRELLLALMRNPGVIPNVNPFTYPQNAPNVPKEFGQEVLEFAQALERDPNRRATGLEEVVELIGKMGVINPLKTAGSLMQLDKPTVERMAQSGVEAAKRAYDDPPGTASRLAQGAKEALLDPVGTAGELSVSDVAGGSGLLSKLAGGSSLTGPALMAAMVPGSDVPRPKKSRSEELIQEQLDFGEEKKDAINLLKENPNNPIDPFKFPAKAIPEAAPLRTQSWPTGSGKNGEIRVLSLFDGLGGARIAFNNLDAPVEYIASEIDPYAIKVHKNNFPDTKHIGDVTKISGENLGPIDVLVGGSPCQDLSVGKAGRMGLEGPNSKLFYDYVRMLEETNPKYFIFENVASMKPSVKEEITKIFGVEPIMIDAKDVSAQNRKRYFWTNIPVDLPKNKNIKIQDVLEQNVDPKYYHTQKAIDYMNRKVRDGKTRLDAFGHHTDIRKQDKSRTLTANLRKGVPYNVLIDESGRMRKFTPTEVERLAGVPEGYTEGVSNTQRYKMLGNGFQIQVMEHILSNIPKGE